ASARMPRRWSIPSSTSSSCSVISCCPRASRRRGTGSGRGRGAGRRWSRRSRGPARRGGPRRELEPRPRGRQPECMDIVGLPESNAGYQSLQRPIDFTPAAAAKVKQLIEGEGNPALKLRVYIQGGGCSGFQYGFEFDEEQGEDDVAVDTDGVR